MAYLEAQEAAGNALAIPTKHHASISANLFNPRAAHRVDDFKHLIADALGLELASERVTLSKFGIVGNPTRDRSHIRHSGLGTDRAQALIFDQAAADHLADLAGVFGWTHRLGHFRAACCRGLFIRHQKLHVCLVASIWIPSTARGAQFRPMPPEASAMKRSRSSRGRARKGAVLGSSNARRTAEMVDFPDPCSPDSTITG